MRSLRSLFLCLTLVFLPCVVSALTIDAADRGMFFSNGTSNNPGATSPAGAGAFPGAGARAYYVFDLAGVAGTVSAATFELELVGYNGDATEAISIYRYDDPGALGVPSLQTATDFATSIFHFSDLGGGALHGSAVVSAGDVGSVLSIALDAVALADINAAGGGLYAFGVWVDSTDLGFDNVSFAGAGQSVVERLDLTVVPEPGTALLLGSGLLFLGAVGRR